MNQVNNILVALEKNIDHFLSQPIERNKDIWDYLKKLHPADLADFLAKIEDPSAAKLLLLLPEKISIEVFSFLDGRFQAALLPMLTLDYAEKALSELAADKVTDLFGYLSDSDLKKYLSLLQKKHRQVVISLLSFDPESAGGIMNSEVLTLPYHITIQQGIDLLQRIQPKREHLARIYVTDKHNILIGYINLDELLLNKPQTPLERITHKNELILNVSVDREAVAKKMQHYNLHTAPVTDSKNHFLGIVTADMVFDIFEVEATEDIYKHSGQQSVAKSYFKASLLHLVWQRVPWLIGLLLLQSVSGFILGSYHATIEAHMILAIFITMLIGTGGNAGNQSGAIVLRGLTTGEITRQNSTRVIMRELFLAVIIGFILTCVAGLRVYFDPHQKTIAEGFAVCGSLYFIIVASILLGTFLPLIFERLNIDPANTAAPFLATLMDIIGILIYCIISTQILG